MNNNYWAGADPPPGQFKIWDLPVDGVAFNAVDDEMCEVVEKTLSAADDAVDQSLELAILRMRLQI